MAATQTGKAKAQRPLPPRRQRFVDEYLVDLNATQAAIRAGYSKRSAAEAGYELLRNAQVAAAIAERAKESLAKVDVTINRVLDELALVGFSDIGDVLDFNGNEPSLRAACDIPPRARRAIASVKVRRYVEGGGEDAKVVEVTEFKLWPKDAALEKLGRYLKMFVERHEHEHLGKDGKPLEVRYVAEWGGSNNAAGAPQGE